MKKCNPLVLLLMGFSVFMISSGVAFAELTADEIIAKVDEVRNPNEDFTTVAKVTSYKENREPRTATYEVMAKGKTMTIVKTLEPQTERGRSLLMRDKDFWAFFPDVAKPLRISFQERLIGDVANGDIARTNFAGDYTATLVRMDDFNDKKYYLLELIAKDDSTTYGKVRIWVETETFWPLKADFYAISGRFLKTCSYENYTSLAGKLRPSRLVLRDAVIKGQYSVIEYNQMDLSELPEKYFTKEYLKKLVY